MFRWVRLSGSRDYHVSKVAHKQSSVMQQSRCLQQRIRHGLLLVGQDCMRNACDALKRICRGVLQESQQDESYPTVI